MEGKPIWIVVVIALALLMLVGVSPFTNFVSAFDPKGFADDVGISVDQGTIGDGGGVCPDGTCNTGETYESCPEDCDNPYSYNLEHITSPEDYYTATELGCSLAKTLYSDLTTDGNNLERDGKTKITVVEGNGDSDYDYKDYYLLSTGEINIGTSGNDYYGTANTEITNDIEAAGCKLCSQYIDEACINANNKPMKYKDINFCGVKIPELMTYYYNDLADGNTWNNRDTDLVQYDTWCQEKYCLCEAEPIGAEELGINMEGFSTEFKTSTATITNDILLGGDLLTKTYAENDKNYIYIIYLRYSKENAGWWPFKYMIQFVKPVENTNVIDIRNEDDIANKIKQITYDSNARNSFAGYFNKKARIIIDITFKPETEFSLNNLLATADIHSQITDSTCSSEENCFNTQIKICDLQDNGCNRYGNEEVEIKTNGITLSNTLKPTKTYRMQITYWYIQKTRDTAWFENNADYYIDRKIILYEYPTTT